MLHDGLGRSLAVNSSFHNLLPKPEKRTPVVVVVNDSDSVLPYYLVEVAFWNHLSGLLQGIKSLLGLLCHDLLVNRRIEVKPDFSLVLQLVGLDVRHLELSFKH